MVWKLFSRFFHSMEEMFPWCDAAPKVRPYRNRLRRRRIYDFIFSLPNILYPLDQQEDTNHMKHKIDPRQSGMFDPERQNFSPVGDDRLDQGWQGIFLRQGTAHQRTLFHGGSGRDRRDARLDFARSRRCLHVRSVGLICAECRTSRGGAFVPAGGALSTAVSRTGAGTGCVLEALSEETDPLTLEELARRVQLSPNYLSILFQRQTGLTLPAYRNRLRP